MISASFDQIKEDQLEYLGNEKPVNKISPLVSIHLITYQHASYISQCLENLLNQETQFEYEIVIGEDASTDGTRDICKKYAERHKDRIRLFLRNRTESVFNRNGKTIYFNGKLTSSACRGKYIAFCEGDDYWTDDRKLSKQIKFLEENEQYSGVFSNYSVIGENGDIIKERFFEFSDRDFSQYEIMAYQTPKTLTAMVKSEFLPREIPEQYFKVKNGDLFLFSMISEGGAFRFINEIQGAYRVHGGGIWSASNAIEKRLSHIKTTKEMLSFFKKKDQVEAILIRFNRNIKKVIKNKLKNVDLLSFYYVFLFIYSNVYYKYLRK